MKNNKCETHLEERKDNKNIEMSKDLPTFTPSTDIYEEKDFLSVVCDMPGVDENSVEVSFEDDVLTLVGWQNFKEPENYEQLKRDFIQGVYKRSFTILTDINAEKISANVKNGVLSVTLPIAEKTKLKKIEVKVG